jgi:tight adherence protein B
MAVVVFTFIAFFLAAAAVLYTMAGTRNESKQAVARLEQLAVPQSSKFAEKPLNLRRADQLSALPWLDGILRKIQLSDKLRLLLRQADLPWTVGRLLLVSAMLGCVAATLINLRTGAALLSFLVGVGAAVAPLSYVFQKRAKRFDRMRQHLPEALDLMVAAIRAGHTFASSMSMAAKECPEPIRKEFRQTFDEQNFGLELRVALTNLAQRAPIHEVRIIVTAILIQNETGGNLTEILDKVAYLIREDFRLQRQVRVHTAQGRMTGWVLSLLPPILGFVLYLLRPEHMSVLWTRSAGRVMLYGGIVMTLIGALIIRKIIRIQV